MYRVQEDVQTQGFNQRLPTAQGLRVQIRSWGLRFEVQSQHD